MDDNKPVVIVPSLVVEIDPDAHLRQFLGTATTEGDKLVTTSVLLPKKFNVAIDFIVGSPQTEYQCKSDFLRHAVHELINAWLKVGIDDNYLGAEMIQMREMAAATAQMEKQNIFADYVGSFEPRLVAYVEAGDWEAVLERLGELKGAVDSTQDPSWRKHMVKMLVKSKTVQLAIEAGYDADRDKFGAWQGLVESVLN